MFALTPRPNRNGSVLAWLLMASALFCAGPHTLSALSAENQPGQNSQEAAAPAQQDSGRPEAQRRSRLAQSPELEEFRQWVEQFKLGGTVAASEQRGRELAARRRGVMLKLVEEDPRGAVEWAVPARVRNQLPEGVRREVEEEVSGYGDYLVLVYDEADPLTGEFVRSRTERKVVLDGKTYEARVYGRKEGMTTKLNIPLRGVVVGDRIALAESPVRVLEEEERGTAAGAPGLDAEVGGRVMHFETREQLERFEEELKQRELTINPGTGKAAEADGADAGGADAGGAQAPASGTTSTSAWTQGAKTVLLMRVDFADAPGEPVDVNGTTLTLANAQSLLNNEVGPFYKANSYNLTSITGTVTKVLRMPQRASWYGSNNDPFQLLHDARAAARAAGYRVDNFHLDILAFKRIQGFTWAGLGYIGGKGSWLNGYFTIREAGHELGHNFGLQHANLWLTSDGSIIGAGTSKEYANPFDAMGGGKTTVTHHLSAWYKNLMGWLPNTGVLTVGVGGTYRLQAHDSAGATGRRALKIQRDWNTYYWVEFRQAMTEYPAAADGAVVYWGYGSNEKSNLLDMTPKTAAGADDSPLAPGKFFVDARNGIKVTVVGKVATTPAALDVNVTFTTNLNTLACTPTTTVGGGTINCTVTLNAPAPLAGAEIRFKDNLASTTPPPYLIIPSGKKAATFQIPTSAVNATQTGTFTASYRGVNKTTPLTVQSLAVSSLTLSRPRIGGGGAVTATVKLNGPAPAAGAEVMLGDDIPAASTPASVVVPAGAQAATFSVATTHVSATEAGSVTASLGGVTKSAPLSVDPTALSGFSLRPVSVAGGMNVTATLALNGPAPPGGVTVDLSDDLQATTLPASVTIQEGAAARTFAFETATVDASQSGKVSASYGGVTRLASLTVRPPLLYWVTLAPNSVPGGDEVTGTAWLDGPAPAGGAVVNLSDNLASAATPASVIIPEGARSAIFKIQTSVVSARESGAVTATRGGITKTAALLVRPVGVQSLTVNPNPIAGGSSATGTVVLERASSEATVVTLSDDLPATTIPDSVTVPAGALSQTFQVSTTYAVPSQKGVLTAAVNTESRSLSLSVVNTRSQLLGNISFEWGAAPWVVYTGGESKVINRSVDGTAHSGEFMAYLGGTTPSAEYFYQEVTIPADAVLADVTFFLWIDSWRAATALPLDTMEVQIRDGNDQLLGVVAAFSNLDDSSWYVRHTLDLLPYKGQPIRLYFSTGVSPDRQTGFFIDDVTLDVLQ